MSSDVDSPWSEGVDVLELTDTDLQDGRTEGLNASDPDGELRRLAETYREYSELGTVSEVLDRAMRVELAHLIDSYEVSFSREDYDVAYLIPPVGWLDEREFESLELVDESAVEDESLVAFSVPSAVNDMARDAKNEGAYRGKTALVRAGLERITGQS